MGGDKSKPEMPWSICQENVSNIEILLERSNHQGETQVRIEKQINTVEGKIDILTIQKDEPLLSKKQMGGLVSGIIIIAELAVRLFDKLGW